MNFVWDKDAWQDYTDLRHADKKSVKKINELLKSIERDKWGYVYLSRRT